MGSTSPFPYLGCELTCQDSTLHWECARGPDARGFPIPVPTGAPLQPLGGDWELSNPRRLSTGKFSLPSLGIAYVMASGGFRNNRGRTNNVLVPDFPEPGHI